MFLTVLDKREEEALICKFSCSGRPIHNATFLASHISFHFLGENFGFVGPRVKDLKRRMFKLRVCLFCFFPSTLVQILSPVCSQSQCQDRTSWRWSSWRRCASRSCPSWSWPAWGGSGSATTSSSPGARRSARRACRAFAGAGTFARRAACQRGRTSPRTSSPRCPEGWRGWVEGCPSQALCSLSFQGWYDPENMQLSDQMCLRLKSLITR